MTDGAIIAHQDENRKAKAKLLTILAGISAVVALLLFWQSYSLGSQSGVYTPWKGVWIFFVFVVPAGFMTLIFGIWAAILYASGPVKAPSHAARASEDHAGADKRQDDTLAKVGRLLVWTGLGVVLVVAPIKAVAMFLNAPEFSGLIGALWFALFAAMSPVLWGSLLVFVGKVLEKSSD